MQIVIEIPNEILNVFNEPIVENEIEFSSLYELMCYLHENKNKEIYNEHLG